MRRDRGRSRGRLPVARRAALWPALLGVLAQVSFGVAPALSSARPGGLPLLSVSPGVVPPTHPVTVSASGFAPGETVEVFFDGRDQSNALAGSAGAIAGVGLTVPTSAVPGIHWVEARGRQSDLVAEGSVRVATPWAQFRFSGFGVRLNPYEGALGVASARSLVRRWSGNTSGRVRSSPAVSASRAFVGADDGHLYAFAAGGCGSDSCPPLWSATTGGRVLSSPAFAGGVVYVGSHSGSVSAFDSGTGATLWSTPAKGPVDASPALVAGALYVGSAGGGLYALDPKDGHVLFRAAAKEAVVSSPAVGRDGVVYVGTSEGFLHAIDGRSGSRKWRVPAGGPVRSSPAVADGVVYVGSSPGGLHAFDASTGAPLWSSAIPGSVSSSPAVGYGYVYVASRDGRLYAFDQVCGSPCAPAWSAPLGGPSSSSPALANGVVAVGSEHGGLRVFEARRGRRLRALEPGASIASSPAIADGSLYVGDAGGLRAFGLSPASPAPASSPGLIEAESPIRHVVVIYQENHSFDEVLGRLCLHDDRCDAADKGSLPDGTTVALSPAPDVVPSVQHSAHWQSVAIDGGEMDEFSRIPGCTPDKGYACYQAYRPAQIPNLARLARTFVISDRTFELGNVASWGSHLELVAGTLDGFAGENPRVSKAAPVQFGWGCDSNMIAPWRSSAEGDVRYVPSCVPRRDGSGPFLPSPVRWVPTIMDRLDEAGLPWRIYTPTRTDAALSKYPMRGWASAAYGWAVCPTFAECAFGGQAGNVRPSSQVLADAADGRLPSLSLVQPPPQLSQHNDFSMRRGDNWIGRVVKAIQSGPSWASTAIFITYDDCGCFYDHVPPPPRLGVRVPMVIVSPYARRGRTDSNVASFASMLSFTERVFGLRSLGAADEGAYDYFGSFDFGSPPVLARTRLVTRPLPGWEARWLRRHPGSPDLT